MVVVVAVPVAVVVVKVVSVVVAAAAAAAAARCGSAAVPHRTRKTGRRIWMSSCVIGSVCVSSPSKLEKLMLMLVVQLEGLRRVLWGVDNPRPGRGEGRG